MSAPKILFQFARRYPWRIVLSVVLGFSGAVFNGVGTTLIVPAVFELFGTTTGTTMDLPPVLQQIMGPFMTLAPATRAVAMLSFIVLTILLKNLANYLSIITGESLTRSLTRDMRVEGIDLLLTVDLSYHHGMRVGDIIQRLNDQVGRAVIFISTAIGISRLGVNILFFALVLLSISWRLTLASLVFLAVILFFNRYVIRRSKDYGQMLADASRDYSVRLLETLNGMRLVRAMANEAQEFAELKRFVQAREDAALLSQMNSAVIGPLNEVFSIVGLVSMIFVSQYLLGTGAGESTTLLLTFLFVLSRIIQFVGQLNTARSRLANSSASVEVVYDFLRRDNKPFMPNGHRPFPGLQRAITFDHLWFQYPGAEDWSLQDIQLTLPRGQTLALVGASGAGKSTLADLLPRFYDPQQGGIHIDGADLREFDLTSLRRAMGTVSQETFLFNASIRDNIAYACPDATDEAVVAAAQRANAYEFICALPEGFDTQVGDRGVLLSGGQRQRISIARALLQNPEILILDEATSALDTVSEQVVQAALDALSQERTTLVIAHRLSTIRNADQIAVLDRGRVVEVGTHEELLRCNGHYTYLYTVQFAKELQHQASLDAVPEVSFDMRSSLNTVLGALHLLAEGLLDSPQEQAELLQEACQAALNLLPAVEIMEHGASAQGLAVSPPAPHPRSAELPSPSASSSVAEP